MVIPQNSYIFLIPIPLKWSLNIKSIDQLIALSLPSCLSLTGTYLAFSVLPNLILGQLNLPTQHNKLLDDYKISISDQGLSFEETQHSLNKDQINSKYDWSQMKVIVTVGWTQKMDLDKEIESRVVNAPFVHISRMIHKHCYPICLTKISLFPWKSKTCDFQIEKKLNVGKYCCSITFPF